jgi:CheY-like chemotaxis protein
MTSPTAEAQPVEMMLRPTWGLGALAPNAVRVLVAEDNVVNQQLALRQLKKLGYPADSVANGAEVLDALQRIPYDIILMDCQMPEMDGYEVTKRIRDSERDATSPYKSVPYIIALTANALQGDRERCLTAGMNDYLTKPLHASELELVLKRAIPQLQPNPHHPMSTEPGGEVLDRAIISGLKELREEGQPDPLRQLIELFLKDSHPRLQQMHASIASKELPKLVSAAHSLKGSASNLGARGLAALSSALEIEAKAGRLEESARILQQLEAQFEQVHKALLSELKT